MGEKVVIYVSDKKTGERLERERQQTVRGVWTLKTCEKLYTDPPVLQQKGQHEHKKLEFDKDEADLAEKSKEVEIAKRSSYKFTKWSKLKILLSKKEKEKFEAFRNQYKKWMFFTSVTKLKTTFLSHEWHQTCHLKERALRRENARLESILRIRREYDIDEILRPDSIIFEKIMKYKRDRRKQEELRKERMIKIIEKITREMTSGIRLLKKPKTVATQKGKRKSITSILKKFGEDSSTEMSVMEAETNEQELEVQSKILHEDSATVGEKEEHEMFKTTDKFVKPDTVANDKIKETKHKSLSKEAAKVENDIEAKKEILLDEHSNLSESTVITESKSVEKVFPKDTCFLAMPSVIVFEDFHVNKKYTQTLSMLNKTSKWAYVRFNKVYTDVWEPGVIEVDLTDAAKVKPGLSKTFTVKFSPVNDEHITAEISFLTFKPDDTKTFHELRVSVFCIPARPVPFFEPMEVRYPTLPTWKYDKARWNEKKLIVSNLGGKPFSFVIGERDHSKDCFVWHFDEADAQSVKSLISCASESESGENNMEDTIGNMLGPSTPRKMFQIEVPPKLKCHLRITFRPRHVGLHHEVIKFHLISDERTFHTQDVPIWAEVTEFDVHLNPPCVDLGVAMIDSDVCQQTFNVVHNGYTIVTVVMKTPRCLGSRVTVYPRSIILMPEKFRTVSVRLTPESDFLGLSKRFYDPVTNMLTFPIHVQVLPLHTEEPPPLILKVLVNLTTCHDLVLEPASIDLGLVYTHESVYAEFTLTNNCLSIQEFAFPNLPPFMEIQPNHGFGTILAGETLKLHLIYSPCVTDIPGNEIGANGLAGERSFQIEVVTLAELAGNKEQKKFRELKNLCDRQTIPKHRGLPPKVVLQPKDPEAVTDTNEENGVNVDDSNDLVDSNFLIDEEGAEDTEEMEESLKGRSDQRKRENMITVSVNIVDTFCEMSEQIIEFPATPCGSFSTVSTHLRGINMASYPHCTCGMLKNQEKEFTAQYEFKCSSDQVQIVPTNGILNNKEFVKINFIFRPRLLEDVILAESQKLNIKAETQQDIDETSEEAEKTKRKPKRSRTPKRDTASDKEALSDIDNLAGEINLLETFEPRISTILVTCVIHVQTKDGTDRNEHLFVKLICPVTKPAILILNEDHEMAFGPTPIGTFSRKLLLIKNISNRNVKVDVSILDPFGPFFVAPGKTIETGSILKLPITYRPTQEDDKEELFEVFEFKTGTRWRMKVSGSGVVPSYVLKPRFGVARVEVTDDKLVELKISIHNTGSCPLSFQLEVINILEGNIPRVQDQSREETSKRKKKGKIDGESQGKSPRKIELTDDLRQHEESAIFGGELKQSTDSSCFSFWNFDEHMQLSVREGKKVDFSIRFQRPSKGGKEKEGVETASKGKKKKEKMERKKEIEKTNYCHVAVLKLILGGSILVQDIVMICLIK